ncbi:unnamed protein product [Ilex paraguariensis]|uniref:Kinesin-like protein n=1 Tax=Ilex paraguariensis TaxID=185542 RepID=A0ABC8R3W9_9AQUA
MASKENPLQPSDSRNINDNVRRPKLSFELCVNPSFWKDNNVQIGVDTKKGVYVENLTEVEVTSARDVIQQLVQWELNRVSHHLDDRLNLVDLAGSESCSLETLCTLQFAQCANFVKDHAIVKEDASGDVLAMRMQIQQLKEPTSSLCIPIDEDNEFLRVQNQSELDALPKELKLCIDEKDKLEELEAERASKKAIEEETQTDYIPNIAFNDLIGVKTMVDAIAVASEREAKLYRTVIVLSKQTDEQRMKLEVLIEDYSRLDELYERAVPVEEKFEVKREVENLKYQLMEMHEENEKLRSLYEKAMQEKDVLDSEKMLASVGQRNEGNKGEFNCPEKLVEVGGKHLNTQNVYLKIVCFIYFVLAWVVFYVCSCTMMEC